jgi:hypothetical protein
MPPSKTAARPGGERVRALGAPLAVACVLIVGWLLADPHTPDLAGAVYRVGLFRQLGFAVWDQHWYAGHHLPGYSLLFPPLGAALGVRAVGALCVLISTALFALVLEDHYGRAARWGAAAFAVAAVGDIWLGRLAFALGVSLAVAAVLAYTRGHRLTGAALAALTAAGSPVAGLLLGLAALTGALQARSARPLVALALPGAVVVLALSALFPEGGTEPFPVLSFLATAGAVIAFMAATPREERLLRLAGAVYLLACLLFLLVPSPVGSNIERYGVLLAAPMLLAARPRPGLIGSLALAAIGVWVLWGPVRETSEVDGSAATSASYYAPVERFLDRRGGAPVRVEVPLTRSHWEAALLAPKVSLARGWEKQLDERYDAVLLDGHLTAGSYERWLAQEAVSYVALPDAQLDPSSAAEGRLIRAAPVSGSGPPEQALADLRRPGRPGTAERSGHADCTGARELLATCARRRDDRSARARHALLDADGRAGLRRERPGRLHGGSRRGARADHGHGALLGVPGARLGPLVPALSGTSGGRGRTGPCSRSGRCSCRR